MPERPPLTFQAAAAFRAALRRYQKQTEEACRANGLSAEQYTLLLMIRGAAREESTVTELSELLQLAHNGVAERVRRAEVAGLVQRRRDPDDGRVTRIRLTAKGQRRLEAAFRALGPESQILIGVVRDVDRAGRRR